MNNSRKSKVESRKPLLSLSVSGLLSLSLLVGVLFSSCNPDAKWETENVEITIRVERVSAGFAVCEFMTNKEAYYLIAIEEAQDDFDPMEHQKQFMNMALDSAYAEYLMWRNELWREDEFNVAPFASHALQYGNEYYTFTGLKTDTEYWIYAFVVDPNAMKPAGRLFMDNIHTSIYTDTEVMFEYRVKGTWDYTYPMDDYGLIDDEFPYLAITNDSLELAEIDQSPQDFYAYWYSDMLTYTDQANIIYGVKAVDNDGFNSHVQFLEGHTYYTTIAGFDGPHNHMVTYKFTWTGEDFQRYFREEDALIIDQYNEEIINSDANG